MVIHPYAMFGSYSDSSFLTLIAGRGVWLLVCQSVEKTEMLADYFDGKQSTEPVDLPSTLSSFSQSHYFAFGWLLLDVDSLGGTDPFVMSPLF